jgi:hypothetical protein
MYPKKPIGCSLFGHRPLCQRLIFDLTIAFYERLRKTDSGDVEWYVVSNHPGSLTRSAPTGGVVTDYDRAHFQLYVRLLDAHYAGLEADDICRQILEIDPASDPEGAQETLRSHLARAIWMSGVGFHQI